MLESLEEKPEFEEAGDTAVREAVYTKLEDTGVLYMIQSFECDKLSQAHVLFEKDDYIYNTVKKRINIL